MCLLIVLCVRLAIILFPIMETLNAVQRKSCDGITLLGKLCKNLNVILTVHNQYAELTFHIINVIF